MTELGEDADGILQALRNQGYSDEDISKLIKSLAQFRKEEYVIVREDGDVEGS